MGLYGPNCTAAFIFGRPYGPRCPAARKPSAPTASAARQFSGSSDPTAIVPLTACKLSANMTLELQQRSASADPLVLKPLAGCRPSDYTALAAPQPSTLDDPTGLVALAGCQSLPFTAQIAFSPPTPHWLSAFSLYSSSSTATVGSGRSHGARSLCCMSAIGL